MIEVIANGAPFTNFINITVTQSLDTMADHFSFTASAVEGYPSMRQGDKIVIIVDETPVLTGYIDEVAGTDSEGQHIIAYSGRDRTGDFIDSKINDIDDIRAGNSMTLKKLIEIVIKHLGQDLKVVDTLNPAVFNQAEDFFSPQVGKNAFAYVSEFARKRQALLSSTPDGDILITQSRPVESGATLQSLRGSDSNNIVSQSWRIDSTKVFSRYIHRGQFDLRALNYAGNSTPEQIENQSGSTSDITVRPGRQTVKVLPDSYSSEQLDNSAKWSKQLAKAEALQYSAVVAGHQKPSEGLWEPNTLVLINSDVADISRKMLVKTVTFSQGEGQPSVTNIVFVEKNVYTIDEKLTLQRAAGDQLNGFGTLG